MKKKIILTFLISILSAMFLAPQVFADGGATPGTNPVSGNCTGYWDTCYGVSWQMYEVTADFPAGGVTFHYTANTNQGNRPVYIKGCKKGMTLYNYGFEAHGGSKYWGYQVSTQKNKKLKYAITRGYRYQAKGAYPGNKQTVRAYTTPKGYVYDKDEALQEFKKMKKWVSSNMWAAKYFPGWNIEPADVGAFCWVPSVFYSVSNAKAINDKTGENSYVTTGIVSENKSVTAGVLNAKAGEQVTIIFSHNFYTNFEITDKINWTVNREFSTPLTGGTGLNGGSTAFTYKSNSMYLATSRPYTDGGANYVLRDEYKTTFTTNGKYNFCEEIKINNELTTKACVVVQVGGGSRPDPIDRNCDENAIPVPTSYKRSNASSGTTSVASRVRNASLSNSNSEYKNTVYAKPGDRINWCNAYFPGVQFAAFSDVTINNTDPSHEKYGIHNTTLNNGVFADYSNWQNRFRIRSSNVIQSFSKDGNFADGATAYQYVPNTSNVREGQAGKTLSETINSYGPTSVSVKNEGIHRWSCDYHPNDCDACGTRRCCDERDEDGHCTHHTDCGCKSCYKATCYHTNNFYRNTRSGSGDQATSYVYVPYNFINSAAVSLSSGTVFAGEVAKVGKATVTVNPKWNNETEDIYATQVDNAKVRLIGYTSSSSYGSEVKGYGSLNSDLCAALPVRDGQCSELDRFNNTELNSDGKMSGIIDTINFSDSYNAFDTEAGNYFCVAVAVYPYTSGSDTNMSSAGSKNWYISQPSCKVVTKRPSFQVWGGSVYSEGEISTTTSIAAKRNLRDIYPYVESGNANTTVFSSWVEQAVIANGIVSGLASGAATGDLTASPWGGSKDLKYCKRVPLSIASYSSALCPTIDSTGNAGLPVIKDGQEALISYWDAMEGRPGVTITKEEGPLTINNTNVARGTTRVMKAKGDIAINGNIIYADGPYISQKDIPKMVIYSEGAINISCNVTRIDAIIIAKGWVNTCNSSNQLTVNGMIIAEGIRFDRTYGAGPGRESGTPAEVVNYDSSAVVWGKNMSNVNDFKTLKTVYQHEIAPRY